MIRNRTLIIILSLFILLTASSVYAQSPLETGIREYENENYEEALDLFLKLRQAEPTNTRLSFYTGLTYKKMEKFEESTPYLKEAVTGTPRIKEALTELIDSLYQTDKLDEAQKWISVGEKEGLSSAELLFLKGLVLSKSKKYPEAIQSFEQAKKIDKGLSQSVEFQIATIHLNEGRIERARDLFRSSALIDPKSDIATYAKDYESYLTERIEREKPWKFNLGLGYKYDRNVVTSPDLGPIAEALKDQKKDSAINTTFRAMYTAPFSFTTPRFFYAQYSLYSDQYFHGVNDLISQTLMLMPGYNFARYSLSLPLSFSYNHLNDSRYMKLYGISPTARTLITENNAIELSLGYQRKYYLQGFEPGIDPAEESQDADNVSVSVGWTYFTPRKGVLSIRYTIAEERADGTNWSYRDQKISGSLIHPIFVEKLRIQLSGEIDMVRFKNVHTVYDEKRKDYTYTGTIGFSYEVFKNMDVIARYSYTDNDSNISEAYSYTRPVYFLGVEYNF